MTCPPSRVPSKQTPSRKTPNTPLRVCLHNVAVDSQICLSEAVLNASMFTPFRVFVGQWDVADPMKMTSAVGTMPPKFSSQVNPKASVPSLNKTAIL